MPLAPRYWHTASCYRPPGSRAVQLLVFGGNLPAYTVRLGDMVKCPTTGLRKWRGDFRILQWGEPKACGYVDVDINVSVWECGWVCKGKRGGTIFFFLHSLEFAGLCISLLHIVYSLAHT